MTLGHILAIPCFLMALLSGLHLLALANDRGWAGGDLVYHYDAPGLRARIVVFTLLGALFALGYR